MRVPVKYVDSVAPIPRKLYLRKVISGGQIGVDIAAIKAAKHHGIKTGGHMPKGFQTLEGPRPGYSWMFGMRDDCPDYKTRTWANVEYADATLRIAKDFGTRGEQCTLNAIHHFHKPNLDVYFEGHWRSGDDIQYMLTPYDVAEWIVCNNIRILNVAGNANLSLGVSVYHYLVQVFNILLWE